MSLPLFLSLLSLFWLALHRFLKPPTGTLSLLPSHALTRRSHHELTLKGVHLRCEYTGLNGVHATLGRWLANGKHTALRRIAIGVYECGVVLGVLGMVVALGLMGRTVMNLAGHLLFTPGTEYNRVPSMNTTMVLHKRAFVEDAGLQSIKTTSSTSSLDVQLLIPGVTLPWSAIVPLFLALAFSQAFHEAGHAICAALDRIQLSSTGFSLTLLIPAFFVALPTPLPARGAPRIAAAGALHNLLLFVIFSIPLSTLWTADVSLRGAGIVSVDGDVYDGLADVVSSGDIVTNLDDNSLVGGGAEAWDAYFAHPPAYDGAVGWCVDAEAFASHPSLAKCEGGTVLFLTINAGTTDTEGQARCLNPVPVLASSSEKRCPCGTRETCVRPAPSESPIMRIGLEGGRVVLWRGPRDEVYEQVQVANRLPRFGRGLFGLGFVLIDAVTTFSSYVRALTLSLYLFNLLPLPRLDGAQLLDAVLDVWAARRGIGKDIGLDDVERGEGFPYDISHNERRGVDGRRAVWARRISSGVQGLAIGQLGLCITLGTLVWIKDGLL